MNAIANSPSVEYKSAFLTMTRPLLQAIYSLAKNLHLPSLLCSALTLIITFQHTADAQTKLKIGISAPLTGEGASFGTDLVNVVTFANRELANNRYEIVVEDDHCDGKGAATAAQKLITIDKVSAVFFACDTAALVAGPLYKAKRIVSITPLVTSPRYSFLGDTFFRLAPNDAQNAKILADEIRRKHKRLGILTEGASEYCEDLGREIEKAAAHSGLEVVHERFTTGASDFRTILLRLKARDIDALLINTNSEGPFLVALRQLRQLQMSLPVYGSYAPGSTTFQRDAGTLADGIVFTDFPSLPSLVGEGQELFDRFRQEFGPLKSWDFLFATGFEAFRVIDFALQSGKEPSTAIREQTFRGLIGTYRFDEHGDVHGVQNELRQISGNKVLTLNAG